MPTKVVAQRYELREILGEGGMGIVYRALDTRTNVLVAIKTLKNASDPETLAMFRKEWHELAQITHPNIVGVRDVGEFKENGENVPFFVMPLLQGCTLAALIKSSSPRLTVEHVVEIICQVCRGLNAAHEKELIHRDIKPSNIFVMEDGTAQIIDFGLVQSATAKTDIDIKGTLQYMAPEQTEGKKVTRASDIFSLGVVAYEALTGKQPFWRRERAETAEAVRRFSPPPISELNPKVGELVSKAIHVAMAKQPIHRYSSAREFADTLQKAIHNQPIERFDMARIQPKIARAREAFQRGDCDFASELLTELEAEGNADPQITLLRAQVEESTRQKRVRNLFEAAQTRLEQNEIPLAIAKLSEVLALDPGNEQALSMMKSIEHQRSEQQLSGWMKRAKEHLDRNDFSEARQALSEVFKLQYDAPEALRLRSDLETREKDAAKARSEKEKLYSTALKANERGELSSAISSLEKLLDLNRAVPGAAIPERDKVYQAFYGNMISERSAVDNAYEEASRHLTEKNFEKALQVCDRILAKYPANAQFKALRIKIQDAQGLFLSAYIAEVGKAVESEASLDRRVGLLEEATKKFPNEQQFNRQLKLAREHRDLVASILAKAKSYEEQEQFGEAIQQWKILASTHPLYVGIESEISQLEVRRERQYNEDKKGRWVQRIDQALDNGAFAEALRLAAEALYDFPNDQELKSQEVIAKQGLDRLLSAEQQFEEAKTLRAAGNPKDAVACLEGALKLDERHFGARSMLINLLGEQAHAMLDSDMGEAELLAKRANQLDPEHPTVKRIAAVIAEKRRSESVAAYISRARELQKTDANGARNIIDKALAEYPGDARLLQFKGNLVGTTKASQAAATAEAGYDRTKVYDPAQGDDASILLDRTYGRTGDGRPRDQLRKVSRAGNEREQNEPLARTETATPPKADPPKVPPPPKVKPPKTVGVWKESQEKAGRIGRQAWEASALFWEKAGKGPKGIGIIAAVCLVIAGGSMAAFRVWGTKKVVPIAAQPKLVSVSVRTEPADAQLRVDDVLYTERMLSLRDDKPHPVKVSRLGFQPFETIRKTNESWQFTLQPEPLHIAVSTNANTGDVLYDGRKIGDLEDGSFSNSSIVPDGGKHILSATNETGELFRIAFLAVAGARPAVEPLTFPDLTVTSTLGNQASISSGSPAKLTLPNGEPPKVLNQTGLDIDLESAGMVSTDSGVEAKITAGKRVETLLLASGNAPTLSINSSRGAVTMGSIAITTATKTAVLMLDGHKKTAERAGVWRLKATPGDHVITLTAAGMNDQELKIRAVKGETVAQKVVMTTAQKFATLIIKNGMTGTKVTLDHGQLIGVLNAAGGLTYDKVPAGDHDITLELGGYTSITSRHPFKEGQTLELPGNLKLSRLQGQVTVTVLPANAVAEYRQNGEKDWHTVPSLTFSLAPGNYEFAAAAPGFKRSQKTVIVEASAVSHVDLTLEAEKAQVVLPTSLIQGLTPDQGWYSSNAHEWVPVPSGTQKCTIYFLRPERYAPPHRAPKHLEWAISVDENRISYSVDSHSLTRKSKVNGKGDSASADVSPANDVEYLFFVMLDAHGVTIKNRNQDGAVLDEFKGEGVDWTRARISVRGNAQFDVRK